MEPRSLQFMAEAAGGELLRGSPSAVARRVCTDSRQVQAGDLFIALVGERFDGHQFLGEVAAKGAVAVLAERQRLPGSRGGQSAPAQEPSRLTSAATGEGCGLIAVENTRQALGRLAGRYREDFTLPTLAVCGSNGKTSTKELLASVLRQKLSTLWNEASFNNEIGVPLTLLKLERAHQAAVLEAGTNHPGELAPLLRLIRPNYGVLTCIGREHLEFFGDLAGVAQEEGALAEVLPASGKLVLNGDDSWTNRIVKRTRAAVVRVGFGPGNDWRVASLRQDKEATLFRVEAPVAEFAGDYRISLLGRHQVGNALFAIVLGVELGLSRAEIERGLAECQPAKMRLQVWEFNGVRVLDDAYNANADSMSAALQTLQSLPCKGRRVAVLGEMAELGAQSEAAHEEVGRRAAELGVEQLFALGKMASVLARGARRAGLTRVLEFAEVDSAAEAVKKFLKPGDVLLLKASRAARLERIGERLRGGESLRKS